MLNPKQFHLNLSFEHGTYPTEDGSLAHTITARENGEYRGGIEWGGYQEHPDPVGAVRMWDVDPDHQRKGIGTALWSEAVHFARNNDKVPLPQHAAGRTRAGDAAARKVGRYYEPWQIY